MGCPSHSFCPDAIAVTRCRVRMLFAIPPSPYMLVGKPLGKMPRMTEGRVPVYFGRLLNFSTRSVRDSSSSPSTPREFDDDEESSCALSALHMATSSTLWNISG